MAPSDPPRPRAQARGLRAREAILRTSMTIATVDGLDGLSLSQLAGRLGVSKAGLFAHFASKEELQLATVEYAVARFQEAVVAPVLAEPDRLLRLWRAHEAHQAWSVDAEEQPGGCFFTNTQFEFDMRPGAVRDRLIGVLEEWLLFLERLAASALRASLLKPDVEPRQLAFTLNTFAIASVHQARLVGADEVNARARRAALQLLRNAATDPTVLPEE
jgi:AcrR family transcriptional regulator